MIDLYDADQKRKLVKGTAITAVAHSQVNYFDTLDKALAAWGSMPDGPAKLALAGSYMEHLRQPIHGADGQPMKSCLLYTSPSPRD